MAISSGTLTIIILSAVLLLVVVIYIIIFMQARNIYGKDWEDHSRTAAEKRLYGKNANKDTIYDPDTEAAKMF